MKAMRFSLLALCLLLLAVFVSCTNNGTYYGDNYVPEHDCVFDREDPSDTYLATPATCTTAATYYYRCSKWGCPLKGTETYEYGAPQHTFDGITCTVCGVKESRGLKYDLYDSYTDEVTGENVYLYRVTGRGECTDSVIYVPSTHEGHPVVIVTGFDNDATLTEIVISEGIETVGSFTDCTSLTRVTLPSTVTLIADKAFKGCTSLESINLADSRVETIMEYAFNGCTSLKSITFPSTLTEIGQSAFAASGLTEITVSETVETIGAVAFNGCTSLARVTFTSTPTVGNNPFSGCTALSYVCFPSDFTFPRNIRSDYFDGCDSLSEITVTGTNGKYLAKDGCLIDKEAKKLIFGTKDCVIPDNGSVEIIADYAFYDCRGLVSLVIPEGVTTIEDYAFTACSDLTSITYPSTLTAVDHFEMSRLPRLFEIHDFSGLTNTYYFYQYFNKREFLHVNLDEVVPTRVKVAGDYVFYQNDGELLLINYLGNDLTFTLPDPETCGAYAIYGIGLPEHIFSLTVPNGVTGISKMAANHLTELILPQSLTYIGELSLPVATSLTLPSGITRIDSLTLPKASSLSIPETVETIGELSLYSVTELTLPNSLRSIENLYCTKLLTLNLGTGLESLGESVFATCTHLVEIRNRSSLEIGLESYGLPALIDVLADGEASKLFITDEGYVFYADYYHTYLITYLGEDTEITLPAHPNPTQTNRYYELHAYALAGTNVTSVTVPACVLAIGPRAFYNSKIEKLTLPETLLQIGDEAFGSCTALTELHIPKSVSHIGDNAFPFTDYHNRFTLYFDGDINDYATINFTEYSIDSGCLNYVFIGGKAATDYTSITLNDTIVQIGTYAFKGWRHLKNITIGDSVRSIEEGAFSGAYYLDYVVIGPKVMGVGKDAFATGGSRLVLFDLALLGMENDPEDYTGIRSSASLVLHTRPAMTEDGYLIGVENGVLYLCHYDGKETALTLPSLHAENGYELVPYLFYDCDDITSIVIPEGVTAIGRNAFNDTNKLTHITIPASVTRIDANAFGSCYELTDIHFGGTEEEWLALQSHISEFSRPLGIGDHTTVHFGE